MKQSTLKPLYTVNQIIDGQKHYFSHWERLGAGSKVFGAVWNEYLAYGYRFNSIGKARKLRDKLLKYDPSTKPSIDTINPKELRDSLQVLRNNNYPEPVQKDINLIHEK